MTRLLLVRHGETEWNQSRRYQGQRDIELNAVGLEQAEALERRLSTEHIVAAYASDLQRAMVTAQEIVAKQGLEVVPCRDLRELDFGAFEGLTFDEIEKRYPAELEVWQVRCIDVAPPNGETLHQLAVRVKTCIDYVIAKNPDGSVLVVSHSGPLRALLCSLMGFELDLWWRFRLGTGSLSIVETYPTGNILALLNEVSFQKQKENVHWPSP